jgi:hypothetical protein
MVPVAFLSILKTLKEKHRCGGGREGRKWYELFEIPSRIYFRTGWEEKSWGEIKVDRRVNSRGGK